MSGEQKRRKNEEQKDEEYMREKAPGRLGGIHSRSGSRKGGRTKNIKERGHDRQVCTTVTWPVAWPV